MKKIIIFGLVIIIAVFAVRFIFGGNEDAWICEEGLWVKHGNPAGAKPTKPCLDGAIIVFSPEQKSVVQNPIVFEGKARGFWFFEGSFPVKLKDNNGKEIGVGLAQTQDDWMTENFVNFKGILYFNPPEKEISGELIFKRDNPSGLPENDAEFKIPVKINPDLIVKVYFNNDKLDPEVSCNKVFGVERDLKNISAEDGLFKAGEAIVKATVEELLKGPTNKEKDQDYSTSINTGVKIQKISMDSSIIKIDFNKQLEYQVGGSCMVTAIRAQITETLKQFPGIKNVVISIDGRTEDILQP